MIDQQVREKVQQILTELFSRDFFNSHTAAEMGAARYLRELERAGIKFILEDNDAHSS
jgi:hypothetical protein